MISFEHVIVQRVVLLSFTFKFSEIIPIEGNQDCTNHARNISGTF